jgi:hypothetical protein
MPKVTWTGEDHLHSLPDGSPGAGPSFTTWRGLKFPKGEAVEVTDAETVRKAKNNPFFKVEGLPGRPPKVKDGDDQDPA